jgi:hypothetical protein
LWAGARPDRTGRALIKTKNTVEIEGEEKPALVAEMRVLLVTK